MTTTIRHPGATHGIPTWVRLSPHALRSIRTAAVEIQGNQVRISFFHPTDGGKNAGRINVFPRDDRRTDGRGERVFGCSGSVKNPAVLDFDERLMTHGEKRGVSWSITLPKSATTASRLDFAADLLKQGHDVILSVNDEQLNVHFTTESCACSTCQPTTRKESK